MELTLRVRKSNERTRQEGLGPAPLSDAAAGKWRSQKEPWVMPTMRGGRVRRGCLPPRPAGV